MKKISIIILFAIFFIGCSSNDYKQNSIPMSELNGYGCSSVLFGTSKSGYPEHTTRSKSELYTCTSGCWI